MMGEPMPRSKYHDVNKARLVYAKQRKPRKSETRKLMRRLLHLLEKLLREWNRLNKLTGGLILLTAEQNKRLTVADAFGKLLRHLTMLPDALTLHDKNVSRRARKNTIRPNRLHEKITLSIYGFSKINLEFIKKI